MLGEKMQQNKLVVEIGNMEISHSFRFFFYFSLDHIFVSTRSQFVSNSLLKNGKAANLFDEIGTQFLCDFWFISEKLFQKF